MNEGEGSLVLMSGGMDSSVLLRWLQHEGPDRKFAGLFINWGQSAADRERASAERVAAGAIVPLEIVDVSSWRTGFRDRVDMLKVPRNSILIHLALPYAIASGCTSIELASTPEDREVPDSNEEFVGAINQFWGPRWPDIRVSAPFLDAGWGKERIIRWADETLGPQFVDQTTSCWRSTPCSETGRDWCTACIKRSLAIERARNGAASIA